MVVVRLRLHRLSSFSSSSSFSPSSILLLLLLELNCDFANLGRKDCGAADLQSGGIHFTPGKVLYYGRAELKTSDHRYCFRNWKMFTYKWTMHKADGSSGNLKCYCSLLDHYIVGLWCNASDRPNKSSYHKLNTYPSPWKATTHRCLTISDPSSNY